MAILQCGLQITGETLSALALKQGKTGWTLAGGSMSQVSTDGAELAAPLKSLARSMKAGGNTPFAVALPKQQAIMRSVTLPSTDSAELVPMARFEIERNIPFHPERHCSGHHVMRKLGVEGSEVLLAAIDGPVVQRALDAVQGADLNPQGVTISSVALVNTVLFCRRDWLRNKTVALLSIGLDTLDLVLLTDGRVLFARSVSIDLRSVLEARLGWAGTDPAHRPDLARLAATAKTSDCLRAHIQVEGQKEEDGLLAGWLDRVIQEVRRTYDYARRERKCQPVEAILLTGEGALLHNLDEYFRTHVEADVVTLNPIAGLPGAEGHKFPFDGYEFAIALGAAVAGTLDGAYRIDLTPPDHYRSQSRVRTKRKLIVTAVILAITMILGGARLYQFNKIQQAELEAYNEVMPQARSTAGALKEMQNKLDIIQRYMNDPNNAMAVLSCVSNIQSVNRTLSISTVTYAMGDAITIVGHAISTPEVSGYTTALEKDSHAKNWSIQSQDRQPLNGRDVYGFSVNGSLSDKDEEKSR